MQTYRLYLIGEADGVVYAIKEYEAENEAVAAALAEALVPDESWAGQKLVRSLSRSGDRAQGSRIH